MKTTQKFILFGLAVSASLSLGACGSGGDGGAKHLYTMSNDPSDNHVLVFRKEDEQALVEVSSVSSGGKGGEILIASGASIPDPLQSQSSILIKDSKLYAVNAGSNTISVFNIDGDSLNRVGVVDSAGVYPVSLTSHDNTLFVLNSGGAGNIAGFTISNDGMLALRPETVRSLSGAAVTAPATVSFNPSGDLLIVTEKATNNIVSYAMSGNQTPGLPIVSASSGHTPFGAVFTKNGNLVVAETFVTNPGPPPQAVLNGSAASSYDVNSDGSLAVVSGSVGTGQTAACWIQTAKNDKFAYVTNTASGSVTGYAVTGSGQLNLLTTDGRTGVVPVTGSAPLDMTTADDVLYVLSGGAGNISVFEIQDNGSLVVHPELGVKGLPKTVSGLVIN